MNVKFFSKKFFAYRGKLPIFLTKKLIGAEMIPVCEGPRAGDFQNVRFLLDGKWEGREGLGKFDDAQCRFVQHGIARGTHDLHALYRAIRADGNG